MKYAVIIEKGKKNYSAYVPDLPGCIVTGKSVDETVKRMGEAIEFHLEGMLLDGEPAPSPTSLCCYVDIIEPTLAKKPRRSRRTAS